jgi:hypothetical protein
MIAILLASGLLATTPNFGRADFVVSLDTNWNSGGGGKINGTPPTLTFNDVTGAVKLTITDSLTPNSSPDNIDKVYLNFGPNPASAAFQADLNSASTNHLVFSGQDSASTNLLTGVSLAYNNIKADGTGGNYDVELDFASNQFTPGTTLTYLITLSNANTLNFTADTFDNLSQGASTGNFTASAHIIGGNQPSIYIGGTGTAIATPAPPTSLLAGIGVFALSLSAHLRRRRALRSAA